MNREKLLSRLQKEVEGAGFKKLADRIGINYVTLWRIVKGKNKNLGSVITWDKITAYYK